MKQQQFSYPYSSHQENYQPNSSNVYNRNAIGKNIMKENYYNPSPIKQMPIEPKINYHFSKKAEQDPDNFKEKGRKKFPVPESEIKKAHIFSIPDDPLENAHGNYSNNNMMFLDRNLDTNDIPGSKPGTLQSKVVKNKEMAQKINEFNKKQQGNMMRDSLDLFQNHYNNPEEHNLYNNLQDQHYSNEEDFFQESSRDFHKNINNNNNNYNYSENHEKRKFVAPSNEKKNFSAAPQKEKLENEEEEDEDFINFKKNYSNFYRGYTPDEYSKRKYVQAKKILQAYENIKDDLKMIEIEREKRIIDDPEFHKSLNLFFGVEEKKPKKNQSPHKKKNHESQKDINILQKEISETEERLRKLYLANNTNKEIIPKPPSAIQKKINPTYLSYAGSEISSNYQDKKKYEVDVIGNIVKRNEELDKSFHTIDGIKRFGAGLKNLNQEATLNPIPKRYSEKYQ